MLRDVLISLFLIAKRMVTGGRAATATTAGGWSPAVSSALTSTRCVTTFVFSLPLDL